MLHFFCQLLGIKLKFKTLKFFTECFNFNKVFLEDFFFFFQGHCTKVHWSNMIYCNFFIWALFVYLLKFTYFIFCLTILEEVFQQIGTKHDMKNLESCCTDFKLIFMILIDWFEPLVVSESENGISILHLKKCCFSLRWVLMY